MISINFNFFIQLVSFIIFIFIIKRLLLKPILTIIESREEKVANAQKESEKLKLLLDENLRLYEEKLESAKAEAKQLRDKLIMEAVQVEKKMFDKSREESLKIILGNKKLIEEEIKKAKQHLEKESLSISHQIVEKILGRSISC